MAREEEGLSAQRADPALDLCGVHVAILGWAGSTPRQLRGISGFYRQAGAEVITTTADVFRAMARPDGWAREGRAFAERLVALDPSTLVAHVYSNAGFWTWAATLEALPRPFLSRIRAVLIDSAPGFPEQIEPWFYARYSSMAMMPMLLGAMGRRPALKHRWLSPPVWAFMRLWYHLSPTQIAAASASLGVVARSGDWPHLLLYSANDALVRPHYVERFAAEARRAGRTMELRRWEGGGHVRQMIMYRLDYFGRVAEFLRSSLTPAAGSRG